MRRRILIPLDGTEFRSQALSVVRRVFDPDTTDVFLLLVEPIGGLATEETRHYHGLAEDMWYYSGGVYHEFALDEHINVREERAERLQKDAVRLRKAGYHVCTKIRTGDLADSIIEVTQTSHIDIIAMVTRGRTGLSRMLFGSVADQVLRSVSIPVMLLRSPAGEQEEVAANSVVASF